MKKFYSFYCLGIVCLYAYLSFTGRSIFSPSKDRNWTKPGERTIYFHK